MPDPHLFLIFIEEIVELVPPFNQEEFFAKVCCQVSNIHSFLQYFSGRNDNPRVNASGEWILNLDSGEAFSHCTSTSRKAGGDHKGDSIKFPRVRYVICIVRSRRMSGGRGEGGLRSDLDLITPLFYFSSTPWRNVDPGFQRAGSWD